MGSSYRISQKTRNEADRWVVRLSSDSLTSQEKVMFSEWLNDAPENEQAFDESFATWQLLGTAANLPEFSDLADSATNQAEQGIVRSPWMLAAASITLAFGLFFSAQWILSPSEANVQVLSSSRGQTQHYQLMDGSIVELNTDSAVELLFSKYERRINLLRGEAFFSVAKDKKRPFVVDFGQGSVTAVGTAFNVYKKKDGNTDVVVTEGVVEVKESQHGTTIEPEGTQLSQSQQITLSRRGLGPVRLVDSQRALAWRDRTIIFRDTPLPDALRALGRYTPFQITSNPNDLEHLKVSGTFSLDKPEDTVLALSTAFNLSMVSESEINVRLQPKSE